MIGNSRISRTEPYIRLRDNSPLPLPPVLTMADIAGKSSIVVVVVAVELTVEPSSPAEFS